MPVALVATTVGAPSVPPPPVTAKVTLTPATGLSVASRTRTDGGAPTAVPTVALWEVAEFEMIETAGPATRVG